MDHEWFNFIISLPGAFGMLFGCLVVGGGNKAV